MVPGHIKVCPYNYPLMRGRTDKTGAGRRGVGAGRRRDGSWKTRGWELGDEGWELGDSGVGEK